MNWEKNEFGGYMSNHITITYLGDKIPKYHIIKDGEDWVIGVFYSFIGGEYVPLEEDGEDRIYFNTPREAMEYVENILEKENVK